ncbi:MAG: hypothetical protein ACREYE_01905 [Gammaproteobacteria bacterium]
MAHLESVLTVTAGKVVYAGNPFEANDERRRDAAAVLRNFAPPTLPPASPAWSPVAYFGGYQNGRP